MLTIAVNSVKNTASDDGFRVKRSKRGLANHTVCHPFQPEREWSGES